MPQVRFTYNPDGCVRRWWDSSGSNDPQLLIRIGSLTKTTPQGSIGYGYDLAGNLKFISGSCQWSTTPTTRVEPAEHGRARRIRAPAAKQLRRERGTWRR